MVGDILQPTHLIFVLIVALLVLGPKRLPEVARTLGTGIRDFRSAISGEQTSRDDDSHTDPPTLPDTVHTDEGAVAPEPEPTWQATVVHEGEPTGHSTDESTGQATAAPEPAYAAPPGPETTQTAQPAPSPGPETTQTTEPEAATEALATHPVQPAPAAEPETAHTTEPDAATEALATHPVQPAPAAEPETADTDEAQPTHTELSPERGG